MKTSATQVGKPLRRRASLLKHRPGPSPGRQGLPSEASGQLRIEQQRRLSECYRLLSNRLLQMARFSLPAVGSVDAEDLVQTVFLEAWLACVADSSFLPGDRWFVTRLRSRIVDCHRRNHRAKRLDGALQIVVQAPSPEDVAVANLAVEEFMNTVPDPFDRMTLRLKIQGFRESEIADMLNVRPEARQVRDRLKRLRKRAGGSAVGQ